MKKRIVSLLAKMEIDIERQVSPELICQLFPFMQEAVADQFAARLAFCDAKTGECLFEAESQANCLFVLLAGRLAVSRETGFNDKSQVIALLQPESVVGEGCLAGREKRSATVYVVEDASLLMIERQVYGWLEKEHPAMAVALLRKLLLTTSKRLEKCSERLLHIL